MLIDLHNVNDTMVSMGALQPGLPNPAMIPKNWPVIIIDLQDCFFTLPLHEEDRQSFAFSIPMTNNIHPFQRYHWKVLPQGMKNSPTICQYLVTQTLQPVRDTYPNAYIIHYMDDILLADASSLQLDKNFSDTVQQLQGHGLIISEEKSNLQSLLIIWAIF